MSMHHPISTYFSSPCGYVHIISQQGDSINQIEFLESQPEKDCDNTILLQKAKQQLLNYFDGQKVTFDFAIKAEGTVFQQAVWQELLKIPYGHTTHYGEIAKKVGSPKAVRAVGAANGKNPLAIVVPCHRVIGKDGKLTGYAGGLDRKSHLLQLEALSIVDETL